MATNQEVIRAALELDLSFLDQSLSDKLPFVDIFELLQEYKKFLAIKVIAKDATAPIHLSPSALIDKVWHLHILHTAKYRAACSALGAFIDHDPEGALSSDSVRENRLLLATTHYRIIFNYPAPAEFWALKHEVADATVDLTNESDSSDDGRDNRKRKRSRSSDSSKGQSGETNSRILVRVLTLNGESHSVACRPSDCVEKLKDRIRKLFGTPRDSQRLTFGGRQLEDGKALSHYKIQDGSCVHIVLKLTGC